MARLGTVRSRRLAKSSFREITMVSTPTDVTKHKVFMNVVNRRFYPRSTSFQMRARVNPRKAAAEEDVIR